MKSRFNRKLLSAAVAAGAMLDHSAATAQAGRGLVLDEVVVTATKQEETLSDVGASILAAGPRQIDDLGQRSMAALVESMPNVKVTEAPTGTKLTIRGVGTRPTGGASSAVAMFVDGVYQGNTSLTNNILADMERVEILRGPQGTLFGKNSIAGVMNLITAKPTQDFEGVVDLRVGNRDAHEGTLVLSGGLTDALSARFMAYKQHTGDYLDNTTGSGGAGGTDKESYRLSLNWDISDNSSLWFKYQHDHNKLNAGLHQLIALDPADAAVIASYSPALLAATETELDGHFASGSFTRYGLNMGLNPDTMTSSSRELVALAFNHTFANDFEFTATAGWDKNEIYRRGTVSQNFPLLTLYLNNDNLYETGNLELRLSSPAEERFRYTVGVYAEKGKFGIEDGDAYVNFDFLAPTLNLLMTLPPPLGAGVPAGFLASPQQLTPALIASLGTPNGWNRTTSLAAYAQGTFDFTDEWSLTVGLRFADDEIEQEKYFYNRVDFNGRSLLSPAAFAAVGISPALAQAYSAVARGLFGSDQAVGVGIPGMPDEKDSHRDRAVLPAAKLEFRPDPDALYYFSVQSGYKNGGFSTDGLKYASEFDKETSLAFELGGKWTLADGRGQLTAALFRTDFKDLQVATIDPDSGGVKFENAAKAFTQGIELDARWALTETLSLGAQYAWLNAEYRSFPNAPGNIAQQIANPDAEQDLGGRPLSDAPKNTASASLDYRQPLAGALELQAGVQVSYTDDYYTDLSISEELKAHSALLVNGRLALTDTERQWTVALIGTNLTNDREQMYGTTSSLIGKGSYFGAIRPPAAYWLQLEQRF